MVRFARKGDFWSGLALAGLGCYILSEARHWVYLGEDGPGAGFFPMWYGAAMVVLSLLLVVGAVLKPGADAPPASDGSRWRDLRRALTCWAAFAASIALSGVAGFVPAFALLAWFIVAVMFGQPQRIAISLAVGGAVGFYVLFVWALDLTLPRGTLY